MGGLGQDSIVLKERARYTFNKREYLDDHWTVEHFQKLLRQTTSNSGYVFDFTKAETEKLDERIKKLPGYSLLPAPKGNPYQLDNQRLRSNAGMDIETKKIARDYWVKFTNQINKAKAFHKTLGLAQHNNTYVVRSQGVDTVTAVSFSLKDGLLACPLLRNKEGDGTVPLTSQEALIFQGNKTGKSAGKIIVGGKHAEICTHPTAMEQVLALLKGEFVAKLRTQTQVKQT